MLLDAATLDEIDPIAVAANSPQTALVIKSCVVMYMYGGTCRSDGVVPMVVIGHAPFGNADSRVGWMTETLRVGTGSCRLRLAICSVSVSRAPDAVTWLSLIG